jgi:predicted O-methyltransferase YrrM
MADYIDLNLSPLGWPHTAACLVAMAAFFPLMFIRKGGTRHRAWGRVYAIAYAVACVTGLGIYRLHKFFFPHWLAVGGLVVLGIGYFAARYKPRGWRIIHLTAMLLSASNLFGGAINEAFLRIKPLHAIAGDNILTSPIVGVTQRVFGDVFLILILFYIATLDLREWRHYPRAASVPAAVRPNYGIDAPVVVRNLFLAGVIGVLYWSIVTLLIRAGRVHIPVLIFAFAGMAFGTGILCTLMGFWMIWESKIGKLRKRERLLRHIIWTGREQVLDVGCGRGLVLAGAAKRLKTGRATGIDIWQAEDLTGNCADAALENARRESVDDRVEVRTADMRQMPFADGTFDIVLSRAAIHNIYSPGERASAIREIARVLKPGGQAIIDDIRHIHEYARVFSQSGCTDLRRAGSLTTYVFFTLVTLGSLRPATLLVRKPA